jgi:hypothetical protein
MNIKADGAQTGGAFYILDGEIRIKCGGEHFTAGPGDFTFLPGGIPDTFLATRGPVRGLQITAPGARPASGNCATTTRSVKEPGTSSVCGSRRSASVPVGLARRSADFSSPKTAAITILELHATEPPLLTDKTHAFAEEIDGHVAASPRQDPVSPGGYREHPSRPGRVLRPLTIRHHASGEAVSLRQAMARRAANAEHAPLAGQLRSAHLARRAVSGHDSAPAHRRLRVVTIRANSLPRGGI